MIQEPGHLGDREDEDEVEEELECGHPLLSLDRRFEQVVADRFVEHQTRS